MIIKCKRCGGDADGDYIHGAICKTCRTEDNKIVGPMIKRMMAGELAFRLGDHVIHLDAEGRTELQCLICELFDRKVAEIGKSSDMYETAHLAADLPALAALHAKLEGKRDD